MKKFPILNSEIIINEPYCKIEKQTVEFPDKSTGTWFIKHSNDAVIVIPMTADGQILLQKNYKHGGGEIVTEFCAGLIDEGETPVEAAARELTEETGFSAENFRFLGTSMANPTGSPMKYYFYVAENILPDGETDFDAAEQIEPFLVQDIAAVKTLFQDSNTLTSSATLAALGIYLSQK